MTWDELVAALLPSSKSAIQYPTFLAEYWPALRPPLDLEERFGCWESCEQLTIRQWDGFQVAPCSLLNPVERMTFVCLLLQGQL